MSFHLHCSCSFGIRHRFRFNTALCCENKANKRENCMFGCKQAAVAGKQVSKLGKANKKKELRSIPPEKMPTQRSQLEDDNQ